MSQRQLALAFSNSNGKTKRTKLDSVKCKPLRASCSALLLGAKLARLRVEHPDAAILIEQLIDDALSDVLE